MTLRLPRRHFLGGLAATLAGASLGVWPRRARAQTAASRVIFFYFPDGVPAESQSGEGSAWHPTGSADDFTLPDVLSPLAGHKNDCVFFRGLSMGGTDWGSHPGGAKKLLTGKDGGLGWSLNHYLGQTVGADSPHRHVHLGVMAGQNNASGDKLITYVSSGDSAQTVAPNDDPLNAFAGLFGSGAPLGSGSITTAAPSADAALRQSVLDGVLDEIGAMKLALGATEAAKLDFHLESLREVELRLASELAPPPLTTTCTEPSLNAPGVLAGEMYVESRFPAILRAQIDVMVQAMACGLTRVGTIQCSHHTSDLYMSAFPETEMNAFAQCPPPPGLTGCYGKRSHEASHYGASHSGDLYTHYVAQRKWFVAQLAYLLDQLALRPEGDGTMLDHSLVLLCTEVQDGNVHSHDNMPFILAGRGGGWSTGRLLQFDYQRHNALLVSIARAMGADIWTYGDTQDGPLAGL